MMALQSQAVKRELAGRLERERAAIAEQVLLLLPLLTATKCRNQTNNVLCGPTAIAMACW
jgi:4-amino-4-deoxy-L-arabinose transferase-like glycosyltransferase